MFTYSNSQGISNVYVIYIYIYIYLYLLGVQDVRWIKGARQEQGIIYFL